MPDTDLLIVGAGPAGLFGCFYAGLRGELFPGHSTERKGSWPT
jgi:thioredoxin reductase